MTNFKISIQATDNPLIIKFVADTFLVNYDNFEFNNIDEASNSPLAQQLFHLPFVKKVYISGNFVAIERFSIIEWEDVQNDVALQIENYINSGGQVVLNSTKSGLFCAFTIPKFIKKINIKQKAYKNN